MKKADLRKLIRDGGPYLEKMEPQLCPYLKNIRGKKVIVLQFGDGLLMLACAKKGATVWGVDFSSEQVRLAGEAATYCGVHVKLVEADCQNLPESVPNDYFDLAVAECGIFVWIENIDAWMRNAYRVLKGGGRLVVSDFHPLSMIAEEADKTVTFRKSYFDQHPEIYQPEEDAPPVVEFMWKLSDILNAAIQAGFRIDRVEEFHVEEEGKRVPLLPTDFLLVATKVKGKDG
jgi:ubiquinone/menaquinone biosynthesis C-methylase UbiE